MTARELIEMVDALEIPPKLITNSQYTFTGLEAFCLLCSRFHSVGDMYSLSMLYGSTCLTDKDHLLRPSELA